MDGVRGRGHGRHRFQEVAQCFLRVEKVSSNFLLLHFLSVWFPYILTCSHFMQHLFSTCLTNLGSCKQDVKLVFRALYIIYSSAAQVCAAFCRWDFSNNQTHMCAVDRLSIKSCSSLTLAFLSAVQHPSSQPIDALYILLNLVLLDSSRKCLEMLTAVDNISMSVLQTICPGTSSRAFQRDTTFDNH